MTDFGAAEQWLDAWTASVGERARSAAELAREVAGLTGTATNRARTLRVTVDSTGGVRDLDVDDRIRDLSGAEIGRELMTVIRRAQANLAARVAATVDRTVGADTETGRAVVNSFAIRFPEPPRSPANRDGR